MNKLPQELGLIVRHHITEDKWTLDAIMDITGREVTTTQRALGNSSQGLRRTIKDPMTVNSFLLVDQGAQHVHVVSNSTIQILVGEWLMSQKENNFEKDKTMFCLFKKEPLEPRMLPHDEV